VASNSLVILAAVGLLVRAGDSPGKGRLSPISYSSGEARWRLLVLSIAVSLIQLRINRARLLRGSFTLPGRKITAARAAARDCSVGFSPAFHFLPADGQVVRPYLHPHHPRKICASYSPAPRKLKRTSRSRRVPVRHPPRSGVAMTAGKS